MRPGDVIAERFVSERLASAGGMGSVYRALDRETGEIVAIKTLHQPSHDGKRFLREAHVLAELRHPGVVRYVAHGVTGAGAAYLAIEWLEGHDLEERLQGGPLGARDALALAGRVAEALGAAHARGVIHRDIKPANLFLVGGDLRAVKILDFGVARFGEVSATRTGAVIGTPAYMAPEQARGERGIDARADVFALGAVLFECLTGRPPFVADHLMAVLATVLLEEAPRASELSREVPAELDALIARMLSKDREGRPVDGAAVARAVAELDPGADSRAEEQGAAPPALTGREQRLLGVVLAGAAGGLRRAGDPPGSSRGLGIRLGPSREQGAAKALAPLGAQVTPLMDGSLLVTVRARGSAVDQAAHAARCALALRAVLPDAKMALALGRATLADRQTRDGAAPSPGGGPRSTTPVGEVIDRAAGLLGLAPLEGHDPQPIRLDEVTAGLLDLRFDVRGDAAGLWLQGEREIVPVGRTLLGKPVPFVGRERELDLLSGLFEECASEPVARAVLVTGAAGVGKSRLRAELVERIERRGERALVLQAHGDPMRAGSPFSLIAPAIRRAAGIRGGEPVAVRRQKLRARVGRNLAGADLTRVSEFLGELVSAPFQGDESVELRAARQDPMLMGDQMRRAWEDFLAAECAEQPVVLVLENLHWGDLPSVKFIDAALRSLADRPLLVLALGRPEVRDAFPRLWEGRGVHEVRLAELGRKAGERLVRAVLGDAAPAETVARIVGQAAGNAFYLEELIRAVATGRGDRPPETVLAMVEARLEALDPDARRVLRAASVFGQVFWQDGVAALLGLREGDRGLEGRLRGLAAMEIVSPRGGGLGAPPGEAPIDGGRFPGRPEYAFRSLLLREAAYAMLTEQDRTLGHRLAGAWLEEAGETDAVTLAEHFERGGEPRSAIVWYRNAAEQALASTDLA
ncbi:MAG: protein kinase, partial [Polyangiaceae bacterium]|nr:protein kinase [Polyangiaceae bacterium]